MITVTGKIEDATGAVLHATIDFVSRSTPLASGGIVTANTDARVLSNPSDGTFSVSLAAGNYQVSISAGGQSTTFNIAVPSGNGTATIDTLVTTPLVFPFVAPNTVWNGQWAGNITFQPIPAAPAPTSSLINFAGGNVNAIGDERYTYWVSYQTASGETVASPALQIHESGSANANKANRIFLQANPTAVTEAHLWRTYVDNNHSYDISGFPINVGLLATMSPSAGFYDDWESTTQFAARVDTTIVPPLFNTSAGQLLSSNGTPCAFITDQGLFFPGTNCRVKPGLGLQIYNFSSRLWYTLMVEGATGAEQLAIDAGNPN